MSDADWARALMAQSKELRDVTEERDALKAEVARLRQALHEIAYGEWDTSATCLETIWQTAAEDAQETARAALAEGEKGEG